MDGLTSLFDRYDSAVRKNLDRWRQAVLKVETNTYTSGDLFNDVMSFWLESTVGLAGPLLEVILPKAILNIVKGTATAQVDTPVAETPATAGAPTCTTLVLTKMVTTASTAQQINASKVTASLSPDRKTLTVKLSNLTATGLTLHVGNIYEGTVSVGSTVIAKTYAYVTT